jgi:hypothetical protein
MKILVKSKSPDMTGSITIQTGSRLSMFGVIDTFDLRRNFPYNHHPVSAFAMSQIFSRDIKKLRQSSLASQIPPLRREILIDSRDRDANFIDHPHGNRTHDHQQRGLSGLSKLRAEGQNEKLNLVFNEEAVRPRGTECRNSFWWWMTNGIFSNY